MQMLMALLKNEITIKQMTQSCDLSTHTIKRWLSETTGNQVIHPELHSIMWKDADMRFKDCNRLGGEYGSFKKIRDCIGKTATHTSPEKADHIHALNERVLKQNKPLQCKSEMSHPLFGEIEVTATLNPIRNEHGEAVGLFIYHVPNVNLKRMPFGVIYNILQRGQSNLLLKQPNYEIPFGDITVLLSAREMEVLLYLLIGMTSKVIGEHINISPRTVENIIAALKAKTRFSITSEMVQHIWEKL